MVLCNHLDVYALDAAPLKALCPRDQQHAIPAPYNVTSEVFCCWITKAQASMARSSSEGISP